MNEQVARVAEIRLNAVRVLKGFVNNSSGIIADAEILLKRLQQEVAAKITWRILIKARVFVESVPVTARVEHDRSGGLINPTNEPPFVQVLGATQPLGATYI